MKSKDVLACEVLLQEHGYRLTNGRIALLMFLKAIKKPLTASAVQKEMTHKLDKATLYRALEDFSVSKIVTKINLQNTATYYEFLHEDHHHHHIVCERCGKIEDIENCNQTNLQKEVLSHSRSFTTISAHSLEFFGLCRTCTQ